MKSSLPLVLVLLILLISPAAFGQKAKSRRKPAPKLDPLTEITSKPVPPDEVLFTAFD